MSFTVKDLKDLKDSKKFQEHKQKNHKYILLGEKLYGRRKDLNMTQAELAKKSGIPQNKISEMESGTYGKPGIEQLEKLSVALQIDESYLIDQRVDRKTFEVYNIILREIKLSYSGAMQFMKVPYFIDLEGFREFRRNITGFNYIRFNYGPFDKTVYTYQRIFSGYEKGFPQFKEIILSSAEKRVIKKVLEKYPCDDADNLKKMSYETYPMKKLGATLGGKECWEKSLDFTL